MSVNLVLQIEVSNKRDAEMRKLRRDLEEAQTQRDVQIATLRKKQQEIAGELQEQIDQLQKAKQKSVLFSLHSVTNQCNDMPIRLILFAQIQH